MYALRSRAAWQRNDTTFGDKPPQLLVFRGDDGDPGRPAAPLADTINWTRALLGRVVVFIGDSIGERQALNLLMLASDRRWHTVYSVNRPYRPGYGESFHQKSWCRAICPRQPAGADGNKNAVGKKDALGQRVKASMLRQMGDLGSCQMVYASVCWLSAGKSESPSMLARTVGHTAQWLLASVTTLTRRDIVVANVGQHFGPWDRNLRAHVDEYVAVMEWHASGRWRHNQPLESAKPLPSPVKLASDVNASTTTEAPCWRMWRSLLDHALHIPAKILREVEATSGECVAVEGAGYKLANGAYTRTAAVSYGRPVYSRLSAVEEKNNQCNLTYSSILSVGWVLACRHWIKYDSNGCHKVAPWLCHSRPWRVFPPSRRSAPHVMLPADLWQRERTKLGLPREVLQTRRLPLGWTAKTRQRWAGSPHAFFREAPPQFWKGGVFPGRKIGTTSQNHDCLLPWNFTRVQQATHQRTARVGGKSGKVTAPPPPTSDTLEVLLGPRAFDAYNERRCEDVSGTSIGLLKVWLPSALLGSRESYVKRDCTHSLTAGSALSFANQLLMHQVWRREARWTHPAMGGLRTDTWDQLQQLLTNPQRQDGTKSLFCKKLGGRGIDGYSTSPRSCAPRAYEGESRRV